MAKQIDDLTPAARDLLERSVAWMDRFWDEQAGLLWGMGDVYDSRNTAHASHHGVRETAWYALGLLLRDRGSDGARAIRALEAILPNQFDEPGKPYHGTFYRAPEEPHPPEPATEWRHYDPNWREFIITTLQVILQEYENRLPGALVQRVDAATRRAVAGALERGLRAGYTNIALMNAPMLVCAGQRLNEPDWVAQGEAMGRAVYRLFKLHDAFEEYNSPTYYGPDIYGLGLWQLYCPSGEMQRMGADMESLLWRDIAQTYHAALHNVAGPYDRAYGMDMRRYVAVLGQWIWLETGRENAPFPDLAGPFAHAGDFSFAPLVSIMGSRVPPDCVPYLRAFQGEHCVEHVIADAPRRVASAWLGEQVMIGAEHTSRSKRGYSQFQPATIHWLAEPGRVGWLRLLHGEPLDARATAGRLEVHGAQELTFQIDAPGVQAGMVEGKAWRLPGLTLHVEANAVGTALVADGRLEVRYAEPTGGSIDVVLTVE